MQVNVFMWNVLSGAYANKQSLPSYDEEIFDEETRISQIITTLRPILEQEYVIVLHEVFDGMRQQLVTLADEHDYNLRDVAHGPKHTDHMGSAILWPHKVFRVEKYQQVVIGEKIATSKATTKPKYSCGWQALPHYFYHKYFIKGAEVTPYDIAIRRTNVAIMVKLVYKKDDQPFTLVAYHMPAQQRNPEVMKLHVRTLYKTAKSFADAVRTKIVRGRRQNPLLLCMDMNLTPDNAMYQYLEDKGLISCSVLSKKTEPEFTCHTNSKFTRGEFKGTIDYIWCENVDLKMAKVEYAKTKGLLPSTEFPSDHLWLKAGIYYY